MNTRTVKTLNHKYIQENGHTNECCRLSCVKKGRATLTTKLAQSTEVLLVKPFTPEEYGVVSVLLHICLNTSD
jgi:hypothetical protein